MIKRTVGGECFCLSFSNELENCFVGVILDGSRWPLPHDYKMQINSLWGLSQLPRIRASFWSSAAVTSAAPKGAFLLGTCRVSLLVSFLGETAESCCLPFVIKDQNCAVRSGSWALASVVVYTEILGFLALPKLGMVVNSCNPRILEV